MEAFIDHKTLRNRTYGVPHEERKHNFAKLNWKHKRAISAILSFHWQRGTYAKLTKHVAKPTGIISEVGEQHAKGGWVLCRAKLVVALDKAQSLGILPQQPEPMSARIILRQHDSFRYSAAFHLSD